MLAITWKKLKPVVIRKIHDPQVLVFLILITATFLIIHNGSTNKLTHDRQKQDVKLF